MDKVEIKQTTTDLQGPLLQTLLHILICIFLLFHTLALPLVFVFLVLTSVTSFVLSCCCHLSLLALPSHLHSRLEHRSRTKEVLNIGVKKIEEIAADVCSMLQHIRIPR